MREPTWDLAPAAEVRRQGEQLARRRRTRAAVVGAGLAAVVMVPLAASLGTPDAVDRSVVATPSQPRPEASTGPSWITTVPTTFDLARGLDETMLPATPDDDTLRRVEICGRARWIAGIPSNASDAQAVASTGLAGSRVSRLLVLYPDDTTAGAALDDLRRWTAPCSGSDLGLGAGTESWGYDDAGPGAESLAAVRVGNALLVSRGLGAASADMVDVVGQMCIFTESGCS